MQVAQNQFNTIDGRTREARRFKAILDALTQQLGREPNAAEQLLLNSAATFTMLVELDTQDMLEGRPVLDERLRRNTTAMRSALVALGMARKARDVTKGDYNSGSSMLSKTAAN